MKSNIGLIDRVLRLSAGIALLAFAWWQNSWIALIFALFTFYETLAGWCIMYQLLGKNSCPISTPGKHQDHSQINSKNFGLAGGIVWGLSLLFMALISMKTGYAPKWMDLMSDIYPGYSTSLRGSIVGLVYGFIDGFIGLYIISWIYNKLTRASTH